MDGQTDELLDELMGNELNGKRMIEKRVNERPDEWLNNECTQ